MSAPSPEESMKSVALRSATTRVVPPSTESRNSSRRRGGATMFSLPAGLTTATTPSVVVVDPGGNRRQRELSTRTSCRRVTTRVPRWQSPNDSSFRTASVNCDAWHIVAGC